MRVVAGLRQSGKTSKLMGFVREELQDPEARPILIVKSMQRARHLRREFFDDDQRLTITTLERLQSIRGMGPRAKVFVEDADSLVQELVSRTFSGLEVAAIVLTADEVTRWD